jgi:carboxyl-terminal processing protease
VELSARSGRIIVVAPLPDTPASRAGLRRGDALRTIDGEQVATLPLPDVARRLRGPAGSEVTLTWQRGDDTHTATLARARIHIEPVIAALLPDRVAHIAVRVFQRDTAERLAAAHAALRQQAGGALTGVVLDLRDDPGGLLTEAVDVADLFLPGGDVVETRGRHRRRAWRAQRAVTISERLVVLINGGTASAAEIVAGALRDRAHAPLIGTQSFGKGSVQTVFELGDGSGLKLTVARYFTPDGTPIDGIGLTPDVDVPEVGPVRRPNDATRPQSDPALIRALAWLRGGDDPPEAPR